MNKLLCREIFTFVHLFTTLQNYSYHSYKSTRMTSIAGMSKYVRTMSQQIICLINDSDSCFFDLMISLYDL